MASPSCRRRSSGTRFSHAAIRRVPSDWPLLDWTLYLRAHGARLGKGVYINSLAVTDHNLLEFEDHVVIDDAHLSGHTVERGFVKTASVRLGRNCKL